MRIMGLDFGSRTVGVAVSDPLLLTAQGVEVITRKEENKLRRTLARIEELAKAYEVSEIVIGYPKHMNNDVGERAKLSEEFAAMVERRTSLPTVLWDERLTTVSAHRSLIEGGMRREKRAEIVDEVAAVFILQNYLDYLSHRKEREDEGNS
ncbi:MAG: Holliday junction resolvase RuvX [Lachnospiraceae bacterium]|nr:Holliday junction resolvase RuvX [Lachnospiraceae bacterium]MBQ9563116.1 Holliday junction resolvase RuvX [Lachnospiraceae bacterium]